MSKKSKPDGEQNGEASGIVRVIKNRDYSIINNTGLRDVRLSFGARGVLAYLLSKPDDWQLRVEDLIRQSPQGEHAVRGMLRELKKYGYLKRERHAGKGGRFEWQTTIYEVPRADDQSSPASDVPDTTPPEPDDDEEKRPSGDFPQMEKPQVEKPSVDQPNMARPYLENRPIYEELNNEELNNEELSECVSEGENATVGVETPTRPAPRFEKSSSSALLQPDPYESPELLALAKEFMYVRHPKERDVAHWPEALETMRDWLDETRPGAPLGDLVEAARQFKTLWRDGGQRNNPYLSQVAAHWHRFMNGDAFNNQPKSQENTDGTNQRITAPKFESAAERRGRDLAESLAEFQQRRAALEEQERRLDELERSGEGEPTGAGLATPN